MSDLRDFTGKNRKFTGTIGERVSVGTTVQRVDTQGTIRFNYNKSYGILYWYRLEIY
jgi:hypothetical protein